MPNRTLTDSCRVLHPLSTCEKCCYRYITVIRTKIRWIINIITNGAIHMLTIVSQGSGNTLRRYEHLRLQRTVLHRCAARAETGLGNIVGTGCSAHTVRDERQPKLILDLPKRYKNDKNNAGKGRAREE